MPIDLPPKIQNHLVYYMQEANQTNNSNEVNMQSETKASKEKRRQHLQHLAGYALQLRQAKTPGVQLWSRLTAEATDYYRQSDLEPDAQADAAMQDLAIVILGPFALKYLQWFEQITPDLTQDPLVHRFLKEIPVLLDIPHEKTIESFSNLLEFGPIWRQAGYMSKIDDSLDPGLDSHNGADFRPEIDDQSDNQIFHTFFYQFMAYVTQAKMTIRAASVYHELFDKGGSEQDHTAALIGIESGSLWRQWRNQGEPQLELWDQLILAAYGQADMPASSPQSVLAFRQSIDDLVQRPDFLDNALRSLEYGLIRMVKGQSQE